MKTPPIFKPARTIQCAASGSVYEIVEAKVVAEQPVLLSVNGEAWLTLICTPQVLEALAVGFLYNEGILQSMAEVASCQLSPDYTSIEITLRHPVHKPTHWHRTITSMSGLPDDATTPWKAPCRNQIYLNLRKFPACFAILSSNKSYITKSADFIPPRSAMVTRFYCWLKILDGTIRLINLPDSH
ncbi:MAG: formate dehydrogenase accessory sulfurtransferase FdhD [Anaerolineaceae bacterium]|nr:formate dehydrogenase accessory sulfurtransferase FdhD [Anaerolineaceae bacterium]